MTKFFATFEEAEAHRLAYERDRCSCGGSPSWSEHQIHLASCERSFTEPKDGALTLLAAQKWTSDE